MRGRIRFDAQVRGRFGLSPPVEVRYDDFTADITANRLVKAAVARLGRMRIRWRRNRADPALAGRSAGGRGARRVPPRRGADGGVRPPEPALSLGRRTRPAGVARGARRQRPSAAVRLRDHARRSGADSASTRSVVVAPRGLLVRGRITDRAPNPDLYQLLAYATAFDLLRRSRPTAHVVRHAGQAPRSRLQSTCRARSRRRWRSCESWWPPAAGTDPAGRRLTGRALQRRLVPGDDQAARRGRGAAALDLLPPVPGDGFTAYLSNGGSRRDRDAA